MNIRQTIITTAVALTMVALVAPVSTGAVTIAELQAQINALMAQLQALQGNSSDTGGVPSACVGLGNPVFIRNLAVGATGSDVKCGQALLNSHGYQVASSGAGSPGNETMYFGQLTLAAVRRFQAAQGWTPASQVGPLTRGVWNSWLAGTVTPPGPTPTPTPTPVPTGAGLTVMLASDNPAAGSIVDLQGLAPLVKFTFVNGDNTEVKVTSFKVKRTGISADATLTNVYLFDGAKRLTDSASVASTMISFNETTGLFMVPAGGSKTITVMSDIDGAVGETVSLQIVAASDIATNASSVKGSFPISGNSFTIASGSNLATIYMADAAGTTTPSAADINPQNDYAIWYDNAVVGTRAVWLHRISFRVAGSVNRQSDIQNFRLLVSGVQQGAAVAKADANDYVTFDFSANPVNLETGTRQIKVLADIVGGSNKNVYLSLRTAADMTVVDSQINVNLILHRVDTTTSFTAEDSGTQTIGSGTLTTTKMTSSPAGDVVDAANNVTLAKYELKAAGEKVKIESMRISATVSDTGVGQLRNGAVYANGVQIGSTADIKEDSQATGYTTYNFGSSLIVEPGSPVTLEVRADIYDSGTLNSALAADTDNDINAADTILIKIVGGDLNNAFGVVSLVTVDVPSASVSANTMTVRTGGLTLSKYTAYTNQSVVPPLTAYKVGHFTLKANTTEGVNINTIEANLDNVISSYGSNLYVMFGDQTTTVKPTVTADNSWSVNYTLASGQTKDLTVWANISSAAGGTGNVGVYVSGTTTDSATAVTAGVTGDQTDVAGQDIVFTTGSFTPSVDGTTPNASVVAGNQEVVAGKFKYTAVYADYTIKELRFTVNANTNAANNSAAISTAVLKDGSTVVAGPISYDATNSYFNFTGLSVLVPKNSNKVLTLAFNLSNSISSSTSNSQVDVQPTQSYLKYIDGSGIETESTTTYNPNKEVYVHKTVPTFTEINVSNSTIQNNAAVNVYSVKAAADAAGSVAIKQLKFALTWDDTTASASTLQLYAFKLFKDGVDITSLVGITDEDGHDLETSTAANGANENSAHAIVTWTTEDTVAAGDSTTYVVQATPSGFNAADSDEGPDGFAIKLASDTAVNGATLKYLNGSGTPATSVVQLATSAGASGVDANIIWSDNSAVSHTSTVSANTVTATSSGDWSNGYLVKSVSSFAGEAWSH